MAGRFKVEAVFKAVDRITAPVSRMQNRMGKFTRGMERGLRKVNRVLKKTVGMLKRATVAGLKFGAGALVVGLGAVTAALNRTADAADRLAKQSRRLQFPIEELQEWKFVAEQSGISTELLDNSLGAFSKRLGEAKAGQGPLTTGLKKLNPELLAQLNRTESVAAAFAIYIDAIRNAKTATEKAALANAAFSRSGLALVNIADNSSDAIKALRLEQRENGNITLQQAEAAEAYNDAVNSLKRSLLGLLQGVLLPMLPAITETVRAWRELIIANKDLIRGRVVQFFSAIRDAAVGLFDKLQALEQTNGIFERLTEFVTLAADAFAFLAEHGTTIAAVIAGVIGLNAALGILSGVLVAVNLVMAANPITLLVIAIVAAAALIIAAWEPIKSFFANLWDSIGATFDAGVAKIMAIIDKIKAAVATVTEFTSGIGESIGGGVFDAVQGAKSFFGFGGDEENEQRQGPTGPRTVSPQERVARSIEEQRTTSTAEVTIKDETGRAEVTGGRLGTGLQLQPTGAF